MPRNPKVKRCAREGCRAWAKKVPPGSSGQGPDLCASPSPAVAAGAPRENRNAVKRDFHGSVALAGEPEHFDGLSGDVLPSLDSEIALLAQRRDALDAWVQKQVEAGRQ